MGASFAAGPAKDSWLVRQKQVVACHVKVLLLPVTTFLPCFTNDWTQLQGSGQREFKLAKAWVWRREGYFPLPGIIITNTKSTKNATSTNSTTSTKSTVGTTNAKSTTRTKLTLPLILRYQLEVRENKMTEFVKGKVFTIAEVRENKDGQILAKVVSSTPSKFTELSRFIESFIKKSSFIVLHRSMDWSRGTSTASEWRQLTWAVR